ncbi:hypothetical protein D9758_010086 [Tetrapyrgos nigripes]|uniref:Uncharacterized protein n=1 Tax=Tetrapyrgos nigripes TaxID=182062 RepID=A0A8H5FRI3_9AGAR|nr:hypothetical protein D9758_010086 [Tetrapyrgos nigripes]
MALRSRVFPSSPPLLRQRDQSILLFPNYAAGPTSFPDAASTALLASTVYRHAGLRDVWHWFPEAEKIWRELFGRGILIPTSDVD